LCIASFEDAEVRRLGSVEGLGGAKGPRRYDRLSRRFIAHQKIRVDHDGFDPRGRG
jgi:hypothetical protein